LGTLHERRFFSHHPAHVRGKNLAANPKNYQKCYAILQYSNLAHWHLNHLNPQIRKAPETIKAGKEKLPTSDLCNTDL
jgi:hypothetical protein